MSDVLAIDPSLTAAATAIPPQVFEIHPLPEAPGGFAAEIVGLDLTQPLNASDFARIHQAHLDHPVLVFRQQHITPQQHIDFSRRFGPLQIHVLRNFQLAGHPEILIVSNIRENGQAIGLGDAGHFWHSDLSYKAVPSLGSLLHAQELPNEGGDTLFADQYTAYERLPEELKARLQGLQAEHSYLAKYEELRAKSAWRPALTQEQKDEVAPAVHPVVRTHPETGRKALFISEHFTTRIIGLPDAESRALLDQLFAISVDSSLVYRHRWQPHDMVFWDNRAVQHLASGTPDSERRKLYRTTVEGDAPF